MRTHCHSDRRPESGAVDVRAYNPVRLIEKLRLIQAQVSLPLDEIVHVGEEEDAGHTGILWLLKLASVSVPPPVRVVSLSR